jgi:DNA-binding transcriptional regulator YiaG
MQEEVSMKVNTEKYKAEKEARESRLLAYTEAIQKSTLESSSQIIKELVEERHNQNLTQQEISEMTGILTSNLARFESGSRIPTLLVLQKYASALGKKIELSI